MSPREWECYVDGWGLREEDEWRRTRELYALTFNVNVDANHRKTARELMPLNSEREQEAPLKPIPLDDKLRIGEMYRSMKGRKRMSAAETLKEINKKKQP